jgi:HD-GYP domain-containing protein (c-di-GMP phosphodiesterase class II)
VERQGLSQARGGRGDPAADARRPPERIFSPEHAVDAARDRRDRTYDPVLADLFVEHGAAWLAKLATVDPWDAVLDLEPEPRRVLEGDALDEALVVAADFIDLKSPYMGGHSRRCAQLATR